MAKPSGLVLNWAKSVWRRRATRFALGGAVFYTALYAVVALSYRSFLFPRPHNSSDRGLAASVGSGDAKLLELRASGPDGEDLPVVALFAAPKEDAPLVVFFHGNGEELADLVWLARSLREAGLGILFVEYPGYGLARPAPTTEATIYAVAERALVELGDRGIENRKIVLVGQSLGTGVATEMAVRGHGERLLLISPYTSMVDMVKRFAPILPVRTFVTDRFETLEKAPRVTQTALVVHGDQDKLIPVDMGRSVASRLPHGTMHVVRGGTHNDLFHRKDDNLISLIVSFAKRQGEFAADSPAAADRPSGFASPGFTTANRR